MNTNQLEFKLARNKHKFAYFWFDEPHIFEWEQKDFDLAMKEYADIGINHIIDFSITHIRWSFYPWWDIINKTIEKLTKACHKNNIYLTEHHSSVLLFNPDTPKRVEFIEQRFFGKRKGSYKNWPNFIEYCLKGVEIDGKNLKDMFQVDPSTGNIFTIGEYGTNKICTNNPNFPPLYLNYLETLYKLGIDGIMTDDVSFCFKKRENDTDVDIDVPWACSCEFCRQKFRKETDISLPSDGEEWMQWANQTDNPDYVLWLKFKADSIREFHVKVKEHYEKLNIKLCRPNYSATTIHWTNPGAHCFDFLPALDWVMIENTFAHIKRYSWPEWIIEHNHRFALARHRNIPAIAMFYPRRKDEVEFCWALSLNSGIGYLGTANCEPIDLNPWEKPLREFEKRKEDVLIENKKIARIAFYFSRLSRDIYPDYEGRTRENITTWLLACELKNIPYDLLLPEELSKLDSFELLVLNEAAVMSNAELEQFKAFAGNGGKIILIGKNASKDEIFKTSRTFQAIWGMMPSEEWMSYGKGAIKVLDVEPWTGLLHRRVTAPLRMISNNEPNYNYQPLTQAEKDLHSRIVNIITDAMAGNLDLKIENAPEGLLFHLFSDASGKKILIHIFNAVATLDMPECGYVKDSDPIPFPVLNKKITLKVRKTKWFYKASNYSVKLCQPCKDDVIINTTLDEDAYIRIELNPELFRSYALLQIG